MSRATKILELKEKRANLIHESRTMLDAAENEKRDFTGEEETKYQRIDADIDKLETQIQREERQMERERDLGEKEDRKEEKKEGKEDRKLSTRETQEYRDAYAKFLLEGRSALSETEIRAMQADSDIGGGYLVTPQEMVMQLIKDVDNSVYMRQVSNVIQLTSAKSLGVPTLDKDVDDADWTAELKTGKETEMELGKRELRPHPLAKRAKVSNTLLRNSNMGVEQLVRERLAYKFGVAEEKAFLTGDGNQKPLGIFVASDNGISTDRDVSEGNTATQIKADGLMEAKYSLKEAYMSRARWMFHRDAIKQIRKLKDGNGQYLWQPGISGGAPDRILENPYTMSEYVPNTFSTGNYVGIIGDFQYYWIAEALDMAIQRLVELYAETNQTGFIGRMELDGMPVLEEAFSRVKLG